MAKDESRSICETKTKLNESLWPGPRDDQEARNENRLGFQEKWRARER